MQAHLSSPDIPTESRTAATWNYANLTGVN
jgi:hypothetical protein